jgi:hypothetical protein
MTQFQGIEQPRERRFPGSVRPAGLHTDSTPAGSPLSEAATVEGPARPPIYIPIPQNFDQLVFSIIMVNRARESSIIVEQTVAAGVTGSATVTIPDNEVDIARIFTEAGDGSISYSIDVQSAGQTAVGDHRITGGTREFARYWEKTTQVVINFTNNDLVNSALIQITWTAVRLEISKWLAYSNGLISLIELLGIEP